MAPTDIVVGPLINKQNYEIVEEETPTATLEENKTDKKGEATSARHDRNTSTGVERDVNAVNLYNAIIFGESYWIEGLLGSHPHLIKAKLLDNGYTALHLAVSCKRFEVVRELVRAMSVGDMKIQDGSGKTAFGLAASNGGVEMIRIVDCLIKKNKELLMFEDKLGHIPLKAACLGGHKDMIYHVYSQTISRFTLPEHYATDVLCLLIAFKYFDIALDLFCRCWNLKYQSPIFDALATLASEPPPFHSITRLLVWQRWIYDCPTVDIKIDGCNNEVHIHIDGQDQTKKETIITPEQSRVQAILFKFLGIKQIYDLKVTHFYIYGLLYMLSKSLGAIGNAQIQNNRVDNHVVLRDAIFNAAKLGIPEIITAITLRIPNVLWCTDDEGMSIFHVAVVHRQEKVFRLIYDQIASASKDKLLSLNVRKGTILHLAAESAPQRLLDNIQGAALLMQRELQWFQEVESIVPRSVKQYRNSEKKTPYEVFDENHKELVEQAEKWMKDLAQSSTVVGTLIITIMFAALYTVPGGNNQDTGIPLFLPSKAFKLFIISDAISLFASSTSVLMFLGILTSRFAAKDFLKSLPTKLIVALSSLFISVATMMIAFCSTVVIMLKGQLSFVIPIVLLASIPVSIFVWSQFPLLVTIFRSTYGPGIFHRKIDAYWY